MLWTVLSGCMGPYPLPHGAHAAVCDGALQPGEVVVDGPFDLDGDGYVDGSLADCAAAWPASSLDCDDGDPGVHPHALEVRCNDLDDDCDPDTPDGVDADHDGSASCDDCDDGDPAVHPGAPETCDQLDDDCDGLTDPGCPEFAGFFVVTPRVEYACAFGSVDLVLENLHLLWTPPDAEVLNLSGGKPGTMDGTLHENGQFDVTTSVVLGTPGSCDEYYELSGQFTDEDSFTARFQARFVGSFCANCADQSFDVDGARY